MPTYLIFTFVLTLSSVIFHCGIAEIQYSSPQKVNSTLETDSMIVNRAYLPFNLVPENPHSSANSATVTNIYCAKASSSGYKRIVLRTPNSEQESATSGISFDQSNLYNRVEAMLIRNGYTVKDRGLIQELNRQGISDYSELGRRLDVDAIIDIGRLSPSSNHIEYLKVLSAPDGSVGSGSKSFGLRMPLVELRIIDVGSGNIAGIFSIIGDLDGYSESYTSSTVDRSWEDTYIDRPYITCRKNFGLGTGHFLSSLPLGVGNIGAGAVFTAVRPNSHGFPWLASLGSLGLNLGVSISFFKKFSVMAGGLGDFCRPKWLRLSAVGRLVASGFGFGFSSLGMYFSAERNSLFGYIINGVGFSVNLLSVFAAIDNFVLAKKITKLAGQTQKIQTVRPMTDHSAVNQRQAALRGRGAAVVDYLASSGRGNFDPNRLVDFVSKVLLDVLSGQIGAYNGRCP